MINDHHPKLHFDSLIHAWRGIVHAISTQRNFRLEVIAGLLAICLAYYFEFTMTKMMMVIGTVLVILGFELVNTSIEAAVDSVHVEHNELARVSKDASAAAVLIVTILAAIIGIYLFLPPILALYF